MLLCFPVNWIKCIWSAEVALYFIKPDFPNYLSNKFTFFIQCNSKIFQLPCSSESKRCFYHLATIYFFQIHIENFLHHSIISCNSKNSCCDSKVNPVLKTIKFKIYRWWHKWNTYSLLIWRIDLQRTDMDKKVNKEQWNWIF